MPNQIHNESKNVDKITIVFHAEASDPFLTAPRVKFGIAYEDEYYYTKQPKLHYIPGQIERLLSYV